MTSGFVEEMVESGHVETAFLWFDEFPRHWREHGVQSEAFEMCEVS